MSRTGFTCATLIHPAAWVASSATLAEGVQVMAGAIIQPDCCIGCNVITNTLSQRGPRLCHRAACPHRTGCHAVWGSPDRRSAFIDAGAVVIQGLHIGKAALLGAGATLTSNLEAQQTLKVAAGRLGKS